MEAQGLPRGHVRRALYRRVAGAAVPRWCECGRAVYAGQAGGIPLLLDPAPVSVEGEGLAILDGRWTVTIALDMTMTRRRAGDIRLTTADDEWVCIEHRCAGPLPLVNAKWEPAKKARNDKPPF